MSYCRWSSDGFRSDVYVYHHVDGSWTTHVAGWRRIGLDTLPPDPYEILFRERKAPDNWNEIYKAYHDAMGNLPMEEINLPHVGETFKDNTPQECAATLKMLRDVGYHVPDGVIEALEDEKLDEEGLSE